MSAIEANARGSGPYIVYVNGGEYSRHTAEREALENATEALEADPTAEVYYVHDYTVDVTLVDAPTPVDPPPVDPDPVDPPTDPVDPPPPPADADEWVADWEDETLVPPAEGFDPEAFFGDLYDGGQFNDQVCTDVHLAQVIDGTPWGLDSTFGPLAYQYEIPPNNQCFLLKARDRWRLPQVGEHVFYAFTMNFDAPAGHNPGGGGQHFFHLGHYDNASYDACLQLVGAQDAGGRVSADGRYRVQFLPNWFGPEGDPTWPKAWCNLELRTRQPYDLQLRASRLANSEVRYSLRAKHRVTGVGVPVQVEEFTVGAQTVEAIPARVRNEASHYRVIEVGYNGSSPSGEFGAGVYNRIGDIIVRVTGDADAWPLG